jgi:hypothetical protein
MNHAWLIVGPAGPQRREAARRKAAALIGAPEDRTQMVLEARHADVAEYLAPLRIDDVRQVVATLGRAPLLGGGRAVLFGEMSGSTREAQNALLRIVEEPPEGLSFVGEVARASDLLPTLQSRFAVERLARLPVEAVEQRLRAEHPALAPEIVRTAATYGRGYIDPAREALDALSVVAEQLPEDDGLPDWFARAAAAVESAGETWLNGLASTFSAQFETTADTRYLRAWQKVEEMRTALSRNANSRLAAEVLFSELSELGVLRRGASGGHSVP